MSIRQNRTFYETRKATLQNWLKEPSIKLTRNQPPNEELLKDIEKYPDNYMYERAQRFHCSKSGVEAALRCLYKINIAPKPLLSSIKP